MESKQWDRWVSHLTWPCPTCQTGHLRQVPETMNEVASRRERYDDNQYEHLNRFIALLKCDYPSCSESATVAGDHHTLYISGGGHDGEGFDDHSYEVFSIVPSPLPFKLDKKIPAGIATKVREAAALFWTDHKAAANRSREVIEAVLTDLGIPETKTNGGWLSLHKRIEKFALLDNGKWAEQAEILEAAKWLGNEGTHATISREEAIDAFDMLEAVLNDIYVRQRDELLKKVKAANTKYGKPKAP